MLQFITILTISTALSVAAYKIQNNEMQNSKKSLLIPSVGISHSSSLPID